MSKLTEKFEEFDQNNPKVYRLFKKYAKDAIKRGHTKLSGWFIVNIIRWEEGIDTHGNSFKIQNDFIALYVRKFISENPKHSDFFTIKRMSRA